MPGVSLHSQLFKYRWIRRVFRQFYFAYKKYWEDPYARLVRDHPELFKNGHILDVGANIGYTSLLFFPFMDSAYRIYAFEPETANQAFFEESIDSRCQNPARIVLIKTALGAHSGTLQLGINLRNPGDHRVLPGKSVGLEVPCGTLDDFTIGAGIQNKIALIKIDVQGYEAKVCAGMSAVLAANPQCTITFEYCPDLLRECGDKPEDLLAFFTKRGFILHLLDRKNGVQPFSEDLLFNRRYVDLVASRKNLL